MSDWKKRNEDWRDEDELEEEEDCECPWVDSKGKVRETRSEERRVGKECRSRRSPYH